MKVHGELMEHGEVVPHPKVVDEGAELARRFIIRASGRTRRFPSDQESSGTLSLPMKVFEPHKLCFSCRRHDPARTIPEIRGFDWTS